MVVPLSRLYKAVSAEGTIYRASSKDVIRLKQKLVQIENKIGERNISLDDDVIWKYVKTRIELEVGAELGLKRCRKLQFDETNAPHTTSLLLGRDINPLLDLLEQVS